VVVDEVEAFKLPAGVEEEERSEGAGGLIKTADGATVLAHVSGIIVAPADLAAAVTGVLPKGRRRWKVVEGEVKESWLMSLDGATVTSGVFLEAAGPCDCDWRAGLAIGASLMMQ
jgi:hypothetical protein